MLATIGWAAGSRAVHEDGKWVDKGRNVPDQLPRARSVLTRLARLLEQLDPDEEPEAAAATAAEKAKQSRKKTAD